MQLQAMADNTDEESLPVPGHVGWGWAEGIADEVAKDAPAIAMDTANNNNGYAKGHNDILDALPAEDNDGLANGAETTNDDESDRQPIVAEPVPEQTADEPDIKPTVTTDEVFVVEKIIDRRIKGGTVMFKVKWKGYPDSDNTWEDRNGLKCKDLIQEYEDKAEIDRFFDAIQSGLVPDKIIGAQNTTGQVKMAVKW